MIKALKFLLIFIFIINLCGCSGITINMPVEIVESEKTPSSKETDDLIAEQLINTPLPDLSIENLNKEKIAFTNLETPFAIALLSTNCEPCKETITALSYATEKQLPVYQIFRLDNKDSIDLCYQSLGLDINKKFVISGIEDFDNNNIYDIFPFESLPVLLIIDDQGIIRDIQVGFSDYERTLEFVETDTELFSSQNTALI